LQRRAEIKGERSARITGSAVIGGSSPARPDNHAKFRKIMASRSRDRAEMHPADLVGAEMFQARARVGLKQFPAASGNLRVVGHAVLTVGTQACHRPM